MYHFGLSVLVASSYVSSIYFRQPEAIKGHDRNAIPVVQHRLQRITLLSIGLILVIPLVLDPHNYLATIRSFGLVPGFTNTFSLLQDLKNIGHAAVISAILYVGPIVDYFKQNELDIDELRYDVEENLGSLHGFRDLVFAPFTEELIYRAVILNILVAGGYTHLWWTPLLFGIAHIHHAGELYRQKKMPLNMIVFNAAFQTVYTSLFGAVANRIYLLGNNVWASTVVHLVCNLMGFPAVTVEGTKAYQASYYTLLVMGLVAFLRSL